MVDSIYPNKKFGFVRVAAAVPEMKVADPSFNCRKIAELVCQAADNQAAFIVFPELSITGSTCGDLFQQQVILDGALDNLNILLQTIQRQNIFVIVGLPVHYENQLFNCAILLHKGKIIGVVPKIYVPGYKEYYEERWFSSGKNQKNKQICLLGQTVPFGADLIFLLDLPGYRGFSFGMEVCEDLWVPVPPSSFQTMAGAVIIFNPSASNEVTGKAEYRHELVKSQSGRCICGYVYTSCGISESTTDVVFGGHAMIAENGVMLAQSQRFEKESQIIYSEIDNERLMNDRIKNTSFMEFGNVITEVSAKSDAFRKIKVSCDGNNSSTFDNNQCEDNDQNENNYQKWYSTFSRKIDPHPFVPSNPETRDERCREIFSIQTSALAGRIRHTSAKKAIIGISGGLDSTLALLVTARTYDLLGLSRKGILAVTMPGFGTTGLTYHNAVELAAALGTDFFEVDIKEACLMHFKDIGKNPGEYDVVYENVQARERTQVLMDLANMHGGLVIGTGDLSEMALGWSTYNGDHMSMYAVNCSIPKTLVRYLVGWVSENISDTATSLILQRIIATPITPELLPPNEKGEIGQKTEEIIGPYELHDFFLYHFARYGAPPDKIVFLAKLAFDGVYYEKEIIKWLTVFLKRFFSQQYKRSCIPDGPKVGTISLSPRSDWRMPSDASAALWLDNLGNIVMD